MSERQTDPTAVRQQLEALHSESFAWSSVCCGSVSVEAEDVLQMTYLKILDGRARYEGRSAFKTWLFGVIRMTAREQQRRAWFRWLRRAPLEAAADHCSTDAPPDHATAKREKIEQVRGACQQLSARQRQVIMLVFHHDLALDEAAAVMKVSPGSARKHYQRGKERLRCLLNDLISEP